MVDIHPCQEDTEVDPSCYADPWVGTGCGIATAANRDRGTSGAATEVDIVELQGNDHLP